ncbi:hypothetical protein [Streptomyces scopuliridis]|uniref:hypothetical protein n=1 Tax=Streptomyces scopuliridis TaxID=452529 RepID=UPI00344460FD
MTDIRDCVQAMLRQNLATEEARQERIRSFEQGGHRIIGGGQTGESSWEITDWRTGAIIETGTGSYDAYDAAATRLDPDRKWIHVEQFDDDYDEPDVDHAGIPASLAEALRDWLGMAVTSDEDVAAVVGWSVEEVGRHRKYA